MLFALPHDQENLVKIYNMFRNCSLNEDLDAMVMSREYMPGGELKWLADLCFFIQKLFKMCL